jgi:hypothetical protein
MKRQASWLVLGVLAYGCGGSSKTEGAGSVASGGSAGASGSAGAAGSGGRPAPECSEPAQCRLFSDCCTCVALGPDDPDPPSCPADCAQDQCREMGVTAPRCKAGECIAAFDCSGHATCAALPPSCEPGLLPSVIRGCWGPCVPFEQCGLVQDCAQCTAIGQTCVSSGSFRTLTVCVPIPESCGSAPPTCACMGDYACNPATPCVDRVGMPGVYCSCPLCDG